MRATSTVGSVTSSVDSGGAAAPGGAGVRKKFVGEETI